MRIFRPGRSGPAATLGPLEAEIMQLIWAAPAPMLVSSVVDALGGQGRPLSHSAAKAVLNNLVAKHLLTKSQVGKATAFQARLDKAELNKAVISSVIAWLKRDYGMPVISQLVDELAIDDETIAEFERLILERRAKADDASSA
jgi:predicted transcriptional regulator